jgi:hypothetical protein
VTRQAGRGDRGRRKIASGAHSEEDRARGMRTFVKFKPPSDSDPAYPTAPPPPFGKDDKGLYIWFDGSFLGADKQVAIAAVEFLSVGFPTDVRSLSGHLAIVARMPKALGSLGVNSHWLFDGGIVPKFDWERTGAELLDLISAYLGLNLAAHQGYFGPVVLIGDGAGAVEFMRGEKHLIIKIGSARPAEPMKVALSELGLNFRRVEWVLIPREDNRRLEAFTDRVKAMVRKGAPDQLTPDKGLPGSTKMMILGELKLDGGVKFAVPGPPGPRPFRRRSQISELLGTAEYTLPGLWPRTRFNLPQRSDVQAYLSTIALERPPSSAKGDPSESTQGSR